MDDEQLISLVKANQCLYDKYNKKYKLLDVKRSVWNQIAKEMGSTDKECIKRWTVLRDMFSRECRKLDAPGSRASHDRPWPLFKQMRFLKNHIISRPYRSSLNRFEIPISFNSATAPITVSDPLQFPTVWVPPPPPTASAPMPPPTVSASMPPPTVSASMQGLTPSAPLSPPIALATLSPFASLPERTSVSAPLPERTSVPLSSSSPTDCLDTLTSPSPSKSSTARNGKKRKFDMEKEFLDAVEAFREYAKEQRAQRGNEALYGFTQMMAAKLSEMNSAKQTRTMLRLHQVVLETEFGQ